MSGLRVPTNLVHFLYVYLSVFVRVSVWVYVRTEAICCQLLFSWLCCVLAQVQNASLFGENFESWCVCQATMAQSPMGQHLPVYRARARWPESGCRLFGSPTPYFRDRAGPGWDCARLVENFLKDLLLLLCKIDEVICLVIAQTLRVNIFKKHQTSTKFAHTLNFVCAMHITYRYMEENSSKCPEASALVQTIQ